MKTTLSLFVVAALCLSCGGSDPPDPAGLPDGPIKYLIACSSDAACDDGNACTVDACVERACQHAAVANGARCGDGVCSAGACVLPEQ